MRETILAKNIAPYIAQGYKTGTFFTGKGSIRRGSNGYRALNRLYCDTLFYESGRKYDIVIIEGAHKR